MAILDLQELEADGEFDGPLGNSGASKNCTNVSGGHGRGGSFLSLLLC